jgi:hypothetical protein
MTATTQVRFPRYEGHEVEFNATHHLTGEVIRFRLKCLGRSTWTLYTVNAATPRCRFGDMAEIKADLEQVLATGVLPGKPGRP